ncbi:hypothetical protein [Actinomadura parmotrematis]|uniref:Lipoprotein n=1 Tax=Actinomadura parmotrematis TaxID=2864039 RepID=A0ABS7FVS5_9ACTN|nr:hypothetical protein [Actinomadura parmotrematis]MBW8484534.1 hypothetical protein [Actinomadura parmotrematis]
MPRRPLLAVLITALALCAACGGGGDPQPAPSPAARSTGPATVPAAQSRAARAALVAYLHALGKGDGKACSYLSPAYARETFGKNCAAGLRSARARLRPRDLKSLQAVTAPEAEPGVTPGEVSIPFESLRWKDEPALPGGPVAARFTLQRTGKRWLISG